MPIELDEQKLDGSTIGEKRVRLDFNPANSGVVNQIKVTSALLINYCEKLKTFDPRLAALAQTGYEQACMWAVKAATATEKTIDKMEDGK